MRPLVRAQILMAFVLILFGATFSADACCENFLFTQSCSGGGGGASAPSPGPFTLTSTFRPSIFNDDYWGRVSAEASMPIDEITVFTKGTETCNGQEETDWSESFTLGNFSHNTLLRHGGFNTGIICEFLPHILVWQFATEGVNTGGTTQGDSEVKHCDLSDLTDCVPFYQEP